MGHGWIKLEKNSPLPDPNTRVLVLYPGGHIDIKTMADIKYFGGSSLPPTHWMPLPIPPTK